MPQEQEQVDGEEAAQEDAAAVDDVAAEDEEKEEKKEEAEKHWLVTALAVLDGVLVNVLSLKGDLKFINLETQMQPV
ncbi:hypothetical protein L195_g062942, partial [Trifolium pratense]